MRFGNSCWTWSPIKALALWGCLLFKMKVWYFGISVWYFGGLFVCLVSSLLKTGPCHHNSKGTTSSTIANDAYTVKVVWGFCVSSTRWFMEWRVVFHTSEFSDRKVIGSCNALVVYFASDMFFGVWARYKNCADGLQCCFWLTQRYKKLAPSGCSEGIFYYNYVVCFDNVLSNRSQFAVVNGFRSNLVSVVSGPQGGVLK